MIIIIFIPIDILILVLKRYQNKHFFKISMIVLVSIYHFDSSIFIRKKIILRLKNYILPSTVV